MIDRLSAWSDDDSGVHIDTLQDHSDPYTERAWIACCFLSSRLLYTTRLSAKSTWFYLLHWGHCWCHRAAQCFTTHIRWRHTAACQCQAEDSCRLRQQVSNCVADVTQWCSSRQLQLNADKTKPIWIGSRAAINNCYRRRTGHLPSVQALRSTHQTSCATLAFCVIPNWRWRSML